MRGITPTPTELKTRAELLIEARAINALNEYRLVKNGATTYERLGYDVPGNGPAGIKLYEFLAIDAEIQRAETDREREAARRRR